MTDELSLNIGPGMHFAPAPWINVERIHRGGHPEPDILLKDEDSSLYVELCRKYGDDAADNVTRVYCGHIFEHIPQELLRETAAGYFDLLQPGGQLGVCQPDVNIAIEYYRQGMIDLQSLHRHMEVGDVWPVERWEQWYRDGELDPYAMHSWNSVPERMIGLLRAVGFEVEQRQPYLSSMVDWPLTGEGGAQFALVATKP